MRLLDTDTCIWILRGRPEVHAHRLATNDEVCTTWVTVAELLYGAAKSADPVRSEGAVLEFLTSLEVIAPDLASARRFGQTKAMLTRRGLVVADADLHIASVALARGATLVTGNHKHFARMPGLLLEDWLRPLAANQAP